MIKRIGKNNVDVAYAACGPDLECYALGFDQGTFAQGRGYTSYHAKPRPVCMRRHLRGCPTAAVCLDCNLALAPGAIVGAAKCGQCQSTNLRVENDEADQ